MREDDMVLLRRFADTGAQEAFAELVRRNMNAVYSAALRRVGGDSQLAEDVAQQVFIRLATHARSLVRHPMLTAWIYAATRNAAANIVRTEVRRRAREQQACAMDEILGSKISEADWSDVAPHLDEVIDGLSDKDRSAVLLRYFDQLTFAEMARALHSSEDAVRMRVDRALDKMRKSLARRGIASTGAALGGVLAQNVVLAAPGGLAAVATQKAIAAVNALAPVSVGATTALTFTGAVLVVVSSVGGVYLHQVRSETEGLLAREQQAIRALEGARERQVERLGFVVADSAPELSVTQEQRRRTPSGARSSAPALPGPELREGGRRALVAAAYMPFYEMLGLSADQIRRFEEVRLKGAVPSLWVYSLGSDAAASIKPVDTAATPDSISSQLRVLLGPEGYAQYESYSRTIPGRELAARLASAVYQYDPLTAVQAAQLADIVAAATKDATPDLPDAAGPDWDRLLEKASAVLTKQQLDALSGVIRKKEVFYRVLAEQSAPAANESEL